MGDNHLGLVVQADTDDSVGSRGPLSMFRKLAKVLAILYASVDGQEMKIVRTRDSRTRGVG